MTLFPHKKSDVISVLPMKLQEYTLRPSKHFVLTWMKKWGYDLYSLQEALLKAYKINKVGKCKYEVYIRTKRKSRKFIFIENKQNKEIFIITGAEGT